MRLLDEATQQSLRKHLEAWPDEFSSGCLDWAARRRGIATERVQLSRPAGTAPKEWLHLTIGQDRYLYRTGRLLRRKRDRRTDVWQNVNGKMPRLTQDKTWTKSRLSELGYPIPEGALFGADELIAATDYFLRLGRTACVKPNQGKRGNLVFTRVMTQTAFESAFRKIAESYDDGIIVEEEVKGEAVRFLYVAPRVTAIRVEVPPNIVGDGHRSIADLVAEKNKERDRRQLPSHVPIRVDEEAVRFLTTQDLDLGSVPAAGRRAFLRGTSNAPSGGDMLQWPGSVHPSYSIIVERAAVAMGHLKVAGFDLAIENPQQPAEAGNHRILEVNSSPGLVVFYFPWEGFGQDAAADLLDRMVGAVW